MSTFEGRVYQGISLRQNDRDDAMWDLEVVLHVWHPKGFHQEQAHTSASSEGKEWILERIREEYQKKHPSTPVVFNGKTIDDVTDLLREARSVMGMVAAG
jgi:hypothetical protein